MNNGELQDYLAQFPRDMPVILEKDAEGNGYSPLAEAKEGLYGATCSYAGEVRWPDEDFTDDYDQYERAIVLGPIN